MDDEKDFLELAGKFFEEKEKIDLKTETSAKEGLGLLEDEYYDAIVADYKMSEMDGLEFLEALRTRGDDTPFIIITGKGKEEVAMKALNQGADRYHQKGGDIETLFDEVTQSIVEEVVRSRSETELKTFQKWIRHALSPEQE